MPSTSRPSTNLPNPVILLARYFENRLRTPNWSWLREGVTDMLIADLAKVSALRGVQRERLEEVLREQQLQPLGDLQIKRLYESAFVGY